MPPIHRLAAVALASTALFAGCSKSGKQGPLVAKGDGVAVTAAEFKAKLDEQSPYVRARFATLDRKKELLESLLRFELLAAEAKAQKLDQDPEVQETLKKIMVQRLVRRSVEEGGSAAASEEDARKYYDEHQDEFVKPERLRLSQILLRADKGSAQRAARAAEARKLRARLEAEGRANPLLFASLAREVSDDAETRASGGDLGYRSRQELEAAGSKALADAAFALRNPGDESGVVETDRGLHLLKLTARQPALNRSFDDVKGELVARIGRDRRTKAFDTFVKKLRDRASVEILDAELEKIPVAAAPQAAGRGGGSASP